MQRPIFQTLLDVFWGRPTLQGGGRAPTEALRTLSTLSTRKTETHPDPSGDSSLQSATLFVREAERLVSHTVVSASAVSFRNYYPSYKSMNPTQRKWYFHWRSQVRKGQYPSTDSAYILVHAYELINGVGIKSYGHGFEQLHALWQHYRSQHPILDRSLMGWLEDFALLHGLHQQLQDFRQEQLQNWRESYYPNALSEMLLNQGWRNVPLPLVMFLAQADIRSSSFYQDGNQQLFEQYVPLVLDQIDRAFVTGSDKGILDHFGPPPAKIEERSLFAGAIYADRKQKISVLQAPHYLEHQPLRNFLKTVLRYTEQRLRESTGYRPMAQPVKVVPWLKQQIDSVVPVVKDRGQRTEDSGQ